MRNRFVVTGAPGSGKTPILRELVRLGFIGINEPAREILAEQRAIGGNGVYDKDPQLFCDLMLERAIAEYQRLGGAGEPAFFDRGIPDMVGYAELFALDTSAALAASRRYRYDDVVFVLPAWPEIYVTDGDRRMTFESAQAFGERVREVYRDLGYTIVDVPRDSVETRTRFIAEHVGHARRVVSGRITSACSRRSIRCQGTDGIAPPLKRHVDWFLRIESPARTADRRPKTEDCYCAAASSS